MTLTSFTITDRRNLQHYLGLPIQAVREGSSLWQALELVEQLDQDEGTAIAADIKARLELLVELDTVNGEDSALGELIQSAESQATRVLIPNEIDIMLRVQKPGEAYSGAAAATKAWMDKLIKDIRRDLGLSGQTNNNRINTAYPGGESPHYTKRPSYETW